MSEYKINKPQSTKDTWIGTKGNRCTFKKKNRSIGKLFYQQINKKFVDIVPQSKSEVICSREICWSIKIKLSISWNLNEKSGAKISRRCGKNCAERESRHRMLAKLYRKLWEYVAIVRSKNIASTKFRPHPSNLPRQTLWKGSHPLVWSRAGLYWLKMRIIYRPTVHILGCFSGWCHMISK